MLAILLATGLAIAQGPLEPNPEFDPGNIDLAAHIDRATTVLLEPEGLEKMPGDWRVVDKDFLRMGCTGGGALLLGGEGEAEAAFDLPGEGTYRLWVRSHGASNRGFGVWIGEAQSETEFGTSTMRWAEGGDFDLKGDTITIRIAEAHDNPYADCVLLTRDLELHPDDLRPLRAWSWDEQWARAGVPVGFTAADSMGDIVAWHWDFGDGGTRDEENCAHTFEKPGDYVVTLTVTDLGGKTATHEAPVHVFPATDFTAWKLQMRRRGSARFGDLNGDNQTDVLVGDPYRTVDAYLHDGTLLWSYDSPEEFPTPIQRREHPMVIWDFDGNGRRDVAMWRYIDGKEWLCFCDAMTGEVERKTPWPIEDSYINGRLAVGNLTGKDDQATILMFSGQYLEGNLQQADAYDADLNHLWSYSDEGGDKPFPHSFITPRIRRPPCCVAPSPGTDTAGCSQ